jgi:hypothetical protein
LIPDEPHAADLAQKALKDKGGVVRAGAATSLGNMHATYADASLKAALNSPDHHPCVRAANAAPSQQIVGARATFGRIEAASASAVA